MKSNNKILLSIFIVLFILFFILQPFIKKSDNEIKTEKDIEEGQL